MHLDNKRSKGTSTSIQDGMQKANEPPPAT